MAIMEHDSLCRAATEASLEESSFDFNSLAPKENRTQRGKWKAWQRIVALSCITSLIALICNASILIWALTQPSGSFEIARLLYEGDCSRTASIDFWAHMGINVLSTIILAGGNYANQILSAPTRESIDKAHSQGRSLDVGVPTLKNWSFLGRRSKFLLSSLLVTTIPLHVIYNSTIFSTTTSITVWSAWVTEDFFTVLPNYNSTWFAHTLGNATEYGDALDSIWDNAHGNPAAYDRFTMSECQSVFSVIPVREYSAVLVFTNVSSAALNRSVLNKWPYQSGFGTFQQSVDEDDSLKFEGAYCLALKIKPSCTIEVLPVLLGVVIACNLIKAIVLFNVFHLSTAPIKTVGDAIASFIEFPDPFTKGSATITAEDIAGGSQKQLSAKRYFSGASKAQWKLAVSLCVCYWLIGLGVEVFFTLRYAFADLIKQWQDGFTPKTNGGGDFIQSAMASIIFVNLPQVFLSFVYVFYNALVTSVLLSKEWVSYSFKRRGLRVTEPMGKQRSTYFLSLPYRFSIPMIGFFMVLHWMLSQSLYFITVKDHSPWEPSLLRDSEGLITYAINYSTLAIMISLVVGGILIISLIILGCFKYKPGMPLARSDSRAISAACHPEEGYEDSSKKLQYGILADLGDGRYRVGFSSGPVMPLVL